MKKNIISILLLLCISSAWSDTIKLIVPFAAAGPITDIARAIAPTLSKKLDKTIIIENKPGASGAIAMELVSNSPSDGLTLIMVNNGLLNINPMLNTATSYKSSDVVSVGVFATAPIILYTSSSIPVKNLKELIDYIKSNPGKASWASPGLGTNPHLLGEMLKAQHDLDMVHVMYKGTLPATIDVAEGRVTMMFDILNPRMTSLFDAGKTKPIAVMGTERIPSLPNVPTVVEEGYFFLITQSWVGISVKSDTPEPILKQLRTVLTETVEDPETKANLKFLGLNPSNIKPAAAQKFIDDEKNKWTKVIKKANIKIE